MKKKNLVLGLALCLGAMGVSTAFLSRTKPAVQTEATSVSHIYLKLDTTTWGSAEAYYTAHLWGGTSETTWPGLDLGTGSNGAELSVVLPSANKGYTHLILARWKDDEHTTEWNRVQVDLASAEQYNYFTITNWSAVESSLSTEGTDYTVSEYKVTDGTVGATVSRTETANSTVTFTPADYFVSGTVFGGWYTDSACTAAYTATTLTGDTTLYAKYTTAASAKRVYFGASGWTDVYVYTFGTSETCGTFPGTKMAATAAVTNVNFQSKGLYSYDVPFGTGGDTNIIFSNYSGTTKIAQTADLVLTDSVYYASDSAKDYAGSADLYNAANWVKTIATAVASATNASVCSISKEDATADVALYKGYSTDAQTAINGATLYTWKDINRVDTEKLDVSFAAIYAQLDKISTTSTSPAAGVVLDNNTTPVLVMVISLSVAALAAGGLWMSRRKEH